MRVDRNYTFRVSPDAGSSGARQTARNLRDAGVEKKTADEELNIFETHRPELRDLLRGLNDVVPGAGRLLRAAFELKTPTATAILSSFEESKASGQPETAAGPRGAQSNAKSLDEAAANGGAPALPQNDYIDSDAANRPSPVTHSSEPPVDAQTHSDLANRTRQLQDAFQNQEPGMSQRDAVELLSVIRQLGDAFSQRARENVTKQEFEREKIALRRLIESKGK
jgi:hypothetical protein